jgi:3,2-trans-enoyl-CoA isomerase
LKRVESDKEISGVVLTSAVPGIFSGGLDIAELHQPSRDRLVQFWSALQDLWLTFYGLRLPAVAAINGAAPAGGCMLALCCDERVMLSSARMIGLNETKLGIVAPPNIFEIPFRAVVGARQSERLLQLGKLLAPREALQVGLIDAVVDSDQALADHVAASFKRVSLGAACGTLSRQVDCARCSNREVETRENERFGRDSGNHRRSIGAKTNWTVP